MTGKSPSPSGRRFENNRILVLLLLTPLISDRLQFRQGY